MAMKTTLKCTIGWLLLIAATRAAVSGEPARLQLPLPLEGKKFSVNSIEFSADGGRVCIAGTDYDEMGTSTARVLLIDRTRNIVQWQRTIPAPDGLANLLPVQCLVGTDHVYLLANSDTSLSPPQAQTETHLIAFDMRGTREASRRMDILGNGRHGYTSEYGYAMSEAADGLKVAGYTRDQDGDVERYATYTAILDAKLQLRGAALIRKNGAYTYPPSARIVGDSLYLAGRFFKATVTKDDLGEFAASRLRIGGGYIWSTKTALTERMDFSLVVVDDGTSYSLGYSNGTTMLTVVTPDGKVPAPLSYPSAYCDTRSIALYGKGIVAVREPCSGKGNALVLIDATTGKEQRVKSISDEPLYVATKNSLWAVLTRDVNGKLYLYSAFTGGL